MYITHDDGAEVPEDAEFIVPMRTALRHGWIRFDPDARATPQCSHGSHF